MTRQPFDGRRANRNFFTGPAGMGKKMFTNPPAAGIVMAKELVGTKKFNPGGNF
jgi:hypothetical protein